MKGTEQFKSVIEAHLTALASKDELFAETLKKENKTIDECVNYVIDEVQKSGKNGFADDEIFGMAVHYYDEDDLKAPKPTNCRVVVNHTVELTPEEIQAAKQKALDKIVSEQSKPKAAKATKVAEEKPIAPTLFD